MVEVKKSALPTKAWLRLERRLGHFTLKVFDNEKPGWRKANFEKSKYQTWDNHTLGNEVFTLIHALPGFAQRI